MIITKKYHFYAAHRNENLNDKCANIHGHTYHVEVKIDQGSFVQKETGVSILFSDIDRLIDPIIKRLDHSFLIHENDPLLEYLMKFLIDKDACLNLQRFEFPTSCENIAAFLFQFIGDRLPIVELTLAETTSSSVTIKK